MIARQRFAAEGTFVEVMAPQAQSAEAFLSELRRLMVEHNVYRREVISLASDGRGPMAARGSRSRLTLAGASSS